jgi:hypothetical protein
MPYLKASWIKNIPLPIVIVLILVASSVLGGILMRFFTPSGYVLFIYAKTDPTDPSILTKNPHIAEVRSGYDSRKACEEEGAIYNVSEDGKPISFARCATDCPLYAETERDCKNP